MDPYTYLYFEELIQNLYYYYSKGQRVARLKEVFEYLEEQIVPVANLQGTRWLDGDVRAMERIRKAWSALVEDLSSETKKHSVEKAKDLLKKLLNKL